MITDFPGGNRNNSVSASDGTNGWVCLGNSDSGQKNDLWLLSVGVSNITDKDLDTEILIYPNPVSDYIKFNTSEATQGIYTLYSSSGKTILQGKVTNKIDVINLTNGIYFIRIQSDKEVFTRKIIKE